MSKPESSTTKSTRYVPAEQLSPEQQKLFHRAASLIEREEFSEAIQILESLTKESPYPEKTHLLLWHAYLTSGELEKSAAHLKEEILLVPYRSVARKPLELLLPHIPNRYKYEITAQDYIERGIGPFPKVGIVITPTRSEAALAALISSVERSKYPNLRILLCSAPSYPIPQSVPEYCEIFSVTSELNPGSMISNALNYLVDQKEVEWLGVAPELSVYNTSTLFALAECAIRQKEIQVLSGVRAWFSEPDTAKPLPCEGQRWNRSFFLDEEWFLPPHVYPHAAATFFSAAAWRDARSQEKIPLGEAYWYELLLRLARNHDIYSTGSIFGGPLVPSIHLVPELSEPELQAAYFAAQKERQIERVPRPMTPVIHLDQNIPVRLLELQHQWHQRRKTPVIPRKAKPSATISIVTPSFQQAQFLEAAIDSVLSQGYEHLEYVILDGGSSDKSPQIIQRYEKYLKYWNSAPDGGQYAAIEEGFSKTEGEILAWLNADDMYHPGAFDIVAAIFIERPDIEWIIGVPTMYDTHGTLISVAEKPPQHSRSALLQGQFSDPWIQQESVFFRRSLWDRAGAYLDRQFPMAADLELWARFFRTAQLHTINSCFSGFRQHAGNRSALHAHRYYREALQIVEREQDIEGDTSSEAPPVIELSAIHRGRTQKPTNIFTSFMREGGF